MEHEKLEQLVADSMKSVFGFSLTRLGNVQEAEELTSDILYKLLLSTDRIEDDNRFYGYLWKTAENAYYSYLRRKNRPQNRSEELSEDTSADEYSPEETLVHREELNLLRRELSLLSEQYRRATVLYYMEKKSCSEIARILNISTEMVKYCLFRARKIIREGMNMERLFGEKSYRPHAFEIDFWGTKAGDDREYGDFRARKIKGNILLAAYYAPVTPQEISIELGVSLPYLEDEIALLKRRQYLIEKGGKLVANIPIFTEECTSAIEEKLAELTRETAEKYKVISGEFEKKYGERFADENLMRWQKMVTAVHFALLKDKGKDEIPEDGPYSLVNGGGGRGVVWGRSTERADNQAHGIHGIYNGVPSGDGRGSVVAVNYAQTLNAQDFYTNMAPEIVSVAVDCYRYLPGESRERMTGYGYAIDGKPNFPVYTMWEYRDLERMLDPEIRLLTDLFEKTAETASAVNADLAPSHIRKTAELVASIVYRFNTIETLADTLFADEWLKPVDDQAKPALFAVINA